MCVFGCREPLAHMYPRPELENSGFDCSSCILLWKKERQGKELEAFTLQVPDTLCKAKGFIAMILGWSISLITDFLIHVLRSCQHIEAFVSAKKESVCSF